MIHLDHKTSDFEEVQCLTPISKRKPNDIDIDLIKGIEYCNKYHPYCNLHRYSDIKINPGQIKIITHN